MLFARMLARFVTAGLRVLISTHSDYLVKELTQPDHAEPGLAGEGGCGQEAGYQPGEGLDPGSSGHTWPKAVV